MTTNQAYVDDSGGKGQGEVFVFSALIANVDIWTPVVDSWDAALNASPRIGYFKMDEAAGRDKEFRGFSQEERDEKLRTLCAVINRREITELSCTLVLEDFANHWAPMLGRPASEPYFFPFQVVTSGIAAELAGRGVVDPCEIFFDEHVIFGPRAKAWYPVLRETFKPSVRSVMPVEPNFRSDLDVIALQCSDLTAWMQRNANEHGLGEFEWLWDELKWLTRSGMSRVIDKEWIQKMLRHEYSPEELHRNAAAMERYREIFGHEWPPQTKPQKKRHTGRL